MASKLLIATMLSMLLISTSGTRANAFTNGQSASIVIGQKDFTSAIPGTSQSEFDYPIDVVFDSSGNMWVADKANNRLLEFRPPFSTDMSASLVIGQPSFTTNGIATTQRGDYTPDGLAFDSSGNLWLADHGNNRVLEFKPPFENGMPAALVIGQKNFTTADVRMGSKDGLFRPNDIVFNSSGNLWIADNGDNRILEFQPPFTNGMSASLVIGQANFETYAASTTKNGLSMGEGDLAVDASGNLWVGDFDNNRVLEFRAPLSSGMDASLVIGQKDFISGGGSLSRATISGPDQVTFDSAGNLWVSDHVNARLLEFQPPFNTGMDASLVIGQPDFTSSTPGPSQSLVSNPDRPGFDSSGNIWVPDANNNRVLEFSSTPVPEFPTASLAIVALAALAAVAVITRRFLFVRQPSPVS